MRRLALIVALLAAACSQSSLNTEHSLVVVNESDVPLRVHPTNGEPEIDYVVGPGETVRIEGLNLPTYSDTVGDTVIDIGRALLWTEDCQPITVAEVSTGPYEIRIAADLGVTAEPAGDDSDEAPLAESVSPAC